MYSRIMLSNLSDLESQSQLAVVQSLQSRRRFERVIDPAIQIAVDEQLLPQQRHQVGQTPAELGSQLQVFLDQRRDQRGPANEVTGVPLGPMLLNRLLELDAREQLQQRREMLLT